MAGAKTGRTNYGPSQNAERVVRALTNRGPCTRGDLAEHLGFSEATLYRTMAHLRASNRSKRREEAIFGLPPEEAQLPSYVVDKLERRPGTTAEVLMLGRNAGRVIGVEIGHGHLSVGIGDANGCLLGEPGSEISEESHSIEEVQPHETFERVARMVKGQLEASGTSANEVRAVAVSLPAPVSFKGRTLSKQVLGNYDDVDIPRELGGVLGKIASLKAGTPTIIENDVDVLARGEHRYGKAFGLRDFIVVKCSGGVGSAIVSDERVVRGRSGGGAGEIGHCVIGPEMLAGKRGSIWGKAKLPRKCRCGGWGHLEAYAGGQAIVARAREMERSSRRRLPKKGPLSTHIDTLLERALEETQPYSDAVRDAGALIGIGVNTLIHLFNPQVLLICGKLSEMGDPFLEHVHQECRAHGLLFGNTTDIVKLGTGSTPQARRRIGVRGAVTTALRKSDPPFSY